MKLSIKLLCAFLLVGMIPAAVVSYLGHVRAREALTAQTFSHLQGVRAAKKQSVERYFRQIDDQIVTFSQNRMIVDAMRKFRDAFAEFRRDNSLTDEQLSQMQRGLQAYYQQDYLSEYRRRNTGREVNVDGLLQPLDQDSVALQHFYISANPHPLGSKDELSGARDNSRYSKLHAQYHPIIQDYLRRFGYYDIFLVDPTTGDIVYSVFKELDFSTSLIDGPYAETNFGEAFRSANQGTQRDAVILVDYESYPPSYEDPASFIASPVFDGEEKVGVALFQMPIDRLNEIMGERSGLGRTGETYLVGPDNLMRSDSYLDKENRAVMTSFRFPQQGRVDTEATRRALAGESDTDLIVDYSGNRVLSAYGPVQVGTHTWALIAEVDADEAFGAVKELRKAMLLIGAIALVGIGFFSLLIARLIARPINHAILRLTTTADRLTTTSGEMGGSSQAVELAAGQVEDSSQQLAAGATRQASSLQQISASIEQINVQTKSNAENTQQADRMARDVADVASQGVSAMQRMAETISEIKSSSDQSAAIVKTIEEIAAQTNLLALNAEVEAARVGKGGEGFAVVAGEVRKLAEHSATSANKIASFIAQAQDQAALAVAVSNEMDGLLKRIAEGVATVTAMNSDVSTASSEQAQGVAKVSAAVVELDEVTQSNTLGAEKSATASAQLNLHAETLSRQAAGLQQGAAQLGHVVQSLTRLAGRPTSRTVQENGRDATD